jgi:hypothetical protein
VKDSYVPVRRVETHKLFNCVRDVVEIVAELVLKDRVEGEVVCDRCNEKRWCDHSDDEALAQSCKMRREASLARKEREEEAE